MHIQNTQDEIIFRIKKEKFAKLGGFLVDLKISGADGGEVINCFNNPKKFWSERAWVIDTSTFKFIIVLGSESVHFILKKQKEWEQLRDSFLDRLPVSS